MSVFPHIHTQLSPARNVMFFESADQKITARMHNHDGGFMTIHAMIPGTNRVGGVTKDEITAIIDPEKVEQACGGQLASVQALFHDQVTGQLAPVGTFTLTPGSVRGSFNVDILIDATNTTGEFFAMLNVQADRAREEAGVSGEEFQVQILDAARRDDVAAAPGWRR